jgi:hypothetical protein
MISTSRGKKCPSLVAAFGGAASTPAVQSKVPNQTAGHSLKRVIPSLRFAMGRAGLEATGGQDGRTAPLRRTGFIACAISATSAPAVKKKSALFVSRYSPGRRSIG